MIHETEQHMASSAGKSLKEYKKSLPPKSKSILISDDDPGYSADLFAIPAHYLDDITCVKIPNGLILDRTEALANQIFDDFGNNEPLLCLCILKGGFRFFSDLTQRIQKKNRTSGFKSLPLMVDFIRLKRQPETSPPRTDAIQIIGAESLNSIKGKNLLVVDNVVDTGSTLKKLCTLLKEFDPKSIKTCSLLIKRNVNNVGFAPDYAGFSIPDVFVVGYALDYMEYFRDLEHICALKSDAFKKYL